MFQNPLLVLYPTVSGNAAGRAIDGVRGEGTTVVAVTASGTDLGSNTIAIQNPVYRFSAPSFINNAFPYDSPYDKITYWEVR